MRVKITDKKAKAMKATSKVNEELQIPVKLLLPQKIMIFEESISLDYLSAILEEAKIPMHRWRIVRC